MNKTIKTKKCTKCKKIKPIIAFCKRKSKYTFVESACKKCKNQKSREYYFNNKQQIKQTRKQYYLKNKEKQKIKHKQWEIENPHYKNIYNKEKRKTDINFKLRENIASRIRGCLKHGWKSAPTIELIGCTIKEFNQHLEKQFINGMSWNNYGFGKGKWNIDHKIPLSSFDLVDAKQQAAAFNYKNCQPLWHEDNIKKGNKLFHR